MSGAHGNGEGDNESSKVQGHLSTGTSNLPKTEDKPIGRMAFLYL